MTTPQQHVEVLTLQGQLDDHQRRERHRTLEETRYWCQQYRQLAERAIAALQAQASAPGGEVTEEMLASANAVFRRHYESLAPRPRIVREALTAALAARTEGGK